MLAALGGAAAGVANALQQQRQYNMQQVLMRAQLAAMGASSAGTSVDPNDPTAPGNGPAGGASPMSPGAALMSGASGPSLSGPPIPAPGSAVFSPSALAATGNTGNTTQAGTAGSMLPSSAGNLTRSGVGPQLGNTTQAGTSAIPTDQASVINLARQARDSALSGGSASGVSGGGMLPLLNAARAASAAPGVSATPTPADPIGGVNSGLDATLSDYQKAMAPKGSMALGNGMTMPVSIAPQQAQMLTTLAQAKIAAAQQTQQQQFETGMEKSREGFETGQQQSLLGHQTEQQSSLLSAEAQRQAEQLTVQKQISANQLTLEGKRLDQQHDQMMAMLGFRTTAQVNKAQDDVLKDLQPVETQIMSVQHAQKVLQDGTGNPADVSAGMTAAYAALGGQKNPRLTSQLISVAGGAADEAIPAKIDRIATMAASGKMPPAQLQMMQGALGSALQGYQQQWQAKALAGAQAHPEAPDLADRLAFRGKLVAGVAPGGGPLVSAGKPDVAQYKAQKIGIDQYNKDLAAWYAGRSQPSTMPQGSAGLMAPGAGR